MSLADRRPPTREEYEAYKTRFQNWGRWGDGDELGTLNFVGPEQRKAAAALVREGRSVSLARPIATSGVMPGARNFQPVRHTVSADGGGSSDEMTVAPHGFANSHLDGLCHIFTADGLMYGGRPASDVMPDGARSNAIDRFRDGIVTRGVLYDVARHRGVPHVPVEAPVHGWELADVAAAQGVEPRAGDAVLVRMGAGAFWAANPDFARPWEGPGLHASALEFLFETDASLLGWDLMEAPNVEGYNAPGLPIHTIAIPYMGLPLLDNLDLEDVARVCVDVGRWEFQLVVAPLVLLGGTASLVNPLALF